MLDDYKEDIQKLVGMAKTLGKGTLLTQVQSMLIPHVMEVFSRYNHTQLRAAILDDYPLVATHTPEGVRNALSNVGSDPETRQMFQSLMVEAITPENILTWMEHPEEWLDAEEAEEQREELQKCAEVIRETSGGEEWLYRQVYEIYRMAGITAEDTRPVQADD